MAIRFLQNIDCLAVFRPRLNELIHSSAAHQAVKSEDSAYELELKFACGWSLLVFHLETKCYRVTGLEHCREGARLIQLEFAEPAVILRTTFGDTSYILSAAPSPGYDQMPFLHTPHVSVAPDEGWVSLPGTTKRWPAHFPGFVSVSPLLGIGQIFREVR